MKIQYQPQPLPKAVGALAGANIIAFAAGQNHCIAVDDTGAAYTWGNGGAPLLPPPAPCTAPVRLPVD